MPSDVVIDGARCLERIRRLYSVWNVSRIDQRERRTVLFFKLE